MATNLAWRSREGMIADYDSLHVTEKPAVKSIVGGHLFMRPTEDGWSLFTPQGELVFRGRGVDARRRSLEVAYERGALTVFS